MRIEIWIFMNEMRIEIRIFMNEMRMLWNEYVMKWECNMKLTTYTYVGHDGVQYYACYLCQG